MLRESLTEKEKRDYLSEKRIVEAAPSERQI